MGESLQGLQLGIDNMWLLIAGIMEMFMSWIPYKKKIIIIYKDFYMLSIFLCVYSKTESLFLNINPPLLSFLIEIPVIF